METVTSDIVVKAPVERVYNQWTQFEDFPQFMEAVQEVRQLDDRHLAWRAELLGEEVEWEAEIIQQIPDTRIEWHATSGRENRGVVSFEAWDMGETKVTLEMDYELDGVGESVANALGLVTRRVKGDLERFKEFIESRDVETGAWRSSLADPNRPDERAIAEERQREPGLDGDLGAAPGGTPEVDERRGEVRS